MHFAESGSLGLPPIGEALQNGDQVELERLLKQRGNKYPTYGEGDHIEDENGLFRGTSPILHAARCGKKEIVKAVLKVSC